jgi:hypothetical protein
MIDIKILVEYSRYINLRQVCLLSGLNYNTIKGKVRSYKLGVNSSLKPQQSLQFEEGFRRLGIKKIKSKISD